MKEEKLNKLDLFQKSCYKDKINIALRKRKREGIRYSNEFIRVVKNIPYENIKEYKIRQLCNNSNYILGQINTIGGETEKYYLQLINAIKNNDSIPLEGINNVFFNIFNNIQYIYDLLGKVSFEKIFNCYCSNKNNTKTNAINSIFNYYIREITEEKKEFLNKIINYLIMCDDNKKIECLQCCVEYLNNLFKRQLLDKSNLLNVIMKSNNPNNTLFILGNVVIRENVKNINLINYLLELFSNNQENDNKIIFWKKLIENKQFITSSDFEFQNKVIEFSKNMIFNNNKYVTYEYANIILEVYFMNEIEMKNIILSKLSNLKNIKSVFVLEKIIPILNVFSNNMSTAKILDNLEDDKGNLTKKLVIDLEQKY